MPPEAVLPEEFSPSRYIEKVSLRTGEVLDEAVLPRQLLVHSHRDYHLVDVQARRFMSRLVKATGDEELARQRMKDLRQRGHRTAARIAKMLGRKDPTRISMALFGLKDREYFFRYKRQPWTAEEIAGKLEELRRVGEERLESMERGDGAGLRVLLTGGTGFVGQEVLWQAAHDEGIAEVVVLVRPRQIRDRATGEVTATRSPAERGEALLRRLWLADSPRREKFRFVAGDVEQPMLGLEEDELERLTGSLSHVIHCAASVAFDDPYEKSFSANVIGTLNALRLSEALQAAPGSPFVAHLAIETSYIHGRQTRKLARENEIVFPRNFYNNYYELTKAMASLETERFMLEKGLRVVQLCPAVVIGESRAGNNRGDTKVVNAPVNLFGRAQQARSEVKGGFFERTRASMLARMACTFPADPSAQLNLIGVDRVVEGILAALKKPLAIGARIHLATDNRVNSEQIRRIVLEELGVKVKLAEPTFHRAVRVPVLTKLLTGLKQQRVAGVLEKLGTIFGGYGEWGQPVHQVGNDVRILGLNLPRPNTEQAFRMLCRHNRYVQEFGKVRDPDEISRREKVWWDFVVGLEERDGLPAASLPADAFRAEIRQELDLERFEPRRAGEGSPGQQV